MPHTKIAGVTGSGKSEAIKAILYGLCNQLSANQLEIHIIDLKGGATFAAFELLPQVHKVYATTEEALIALCYCEEVMWERLQAIQEARKTFHKDPWYPLLVLVIDEGGELSPADAVGDEKKLRAACMETLSTLVRVGREPGLRIIYGTQRPDRFTLPMTVRSQLENTLCFRVTEDYDSKIVLGRDGAEKIPRIPGRMIFKSPDRIIPVQGAYVPPDVLEAWVRQVSNFPIDIPESYVDEVETRTKKAREQALLRVSKHLNQTETSNGTASVENDLDLTGFLVES